MGTWIGGIAAVVATTRDAPYPSAWDPRVADLVAFVEDERGLQFEHPTEVAYLDDEAFEDELGVDPAALSAADETAAEHGAAFLRAIGLAEGDVDLAGASSQLLQETTLAFYDPRTKRVVVRGDPPRLDAPTRTTLVHELTHALQDQYFDLRAMQTIADGSAEISARALIEGDATLIEEAYYDELSATDQSEVDDFYDEFSEGTDLSGIPEAITIYQSMPYVFGPTFVQVLRADGGVRAIDDAFLDLPNTEQHVIAPLSYLDGKAAQPVTAPEVGTDELELERESFGAFGLYLMLTERIDAHDALVAIDGWAGDEYVSLLRDGQDCVRAVFVGDSPSATRRIVDALQSWADAGPNGAARAREVRNEAVLDACDPGAGADITTGASSDALSLPASRSQMLRLFLEEDAPLDAAWCAADDVVAESSVDELNDPDGTFFSSGIFDRRLTHAIDRCVERAPDA
jgi:hypothetical protein